MKDPKTICKEHNLYSYQAQKGAELMAEYIKDQLVGIIQTDDTMPLQERIKKFFNLK